MRTSIYTILGIIGIILVVVMIMALTSVTGVIPDTVTKQSEDTLDRYIPVVSSIWSYNDGETYKKLMVTEQVFESEKFKHIIVKGEEDDQSIKSFKDNYAFEYTYKIEENQLTRSLQGNVILDGFENVILLKMPLEEGHKWQDQWTDLNGETYSVTSTIKSVMEDGQVITVESADKSEKFVVQRTLEIGKGVTEFKIIEKYDDIEFETGYQLFTIEEFEYQGFDNYMAFLGNEKIGTDIDTISDSTNSSDEANGANQHDSDSASDETLGESEEDSIIQEGEEIDEEVRLAIENSVNTFNDKWIAFINEGDMSIMETITPGASVEKIIDAYMDKDMTQSFLTIEINRIVLRGNVANAYVYEEIERNMDGKTEVLVYNWIYEIDNIDGKWLVEGYIENKNP